MNKGVALIGGVGLGAALMYIFDPDRGGRRRALIRDKFEAAGNKASGYAEKRWRDRRNRAPGVLPETKWWFNNEEERENGLADGVRWKRARNRAHTGR